MKYAISVVFLCVLMSHVSNIVKVNGQNPYPLCKWYRRLPGKCSPDGNKKCHVEVQRPRERVNQKFESCECTNRIVQKKDHHDCNCAVKAPCR
ncbi:unnamed protein product [Brassica oleracea var. botrytis]|uniref:Uncharacterized protein n=1 Tax=Brassica oleracea var. oleracea TaxID=109376 RepID=A0A0D3BD82_BRAOL